MSAPLILLHGDDGFGLDLALRAFARSVDATERIEIVPGPHARRGARSTAPGSRPAR